MEPLSNNGSDLLSQPLNPICHELNKALLGIFAFQRRFFPLDLSDIGEELKPFLNETVIDMANWRIGVGPR